MQTLSEYLEGRKKADFAAAIGVTPSQLSQYLSKYRRPSIEMMQRIQIASGGAVSIESWLHPPTHAHAPTTIQGEGRE